VIYWKEEPLKAGAKRELGFEYGLWNLRGSGPGLAATVDGVFRPGGELTVVAYVGAVGAESAPETLTLTLPEGFTLTQGTATQTAPPPAKGTTSGYRPVTWKVQAGAVGKYDFVIKSSTGPAQTVPVEIKQREIFQ
jgi:hypothetical protein